VLLPLTLSLLGAPNSVFVLPLLGGAYASYVLSNTLQETQTSVSLMVDARGIFVDGALFARNQDILEAYIRR